MSGMSDVHVVRLKAEHHRESLGIGSARPRLSWQVRTDRDGWTQAAYQISVYSDEAPDRTVLSLEVESSEQVLVPWPLPPLASRDRCTVRVRVWGEDDESPSPWSEPLRVETGLLEPGDWTASMITPALALPAGQDGPA